MTWVERSVDRSPAMQRSRNRRIEQAKVIIDAARRLIEVKGSAFTLQELAKEAEVALQTFYRYFSGKDQLLLAVIEETISESCREYAARSQHVSDPIARLRFYVTSALNPSSLGGDRIEAARFVTAEHWRLHRLFPEELAQATKPFTDLIRQEVVVAAEAGMLTSRDPDGDAWLITQLVTSVFHHYAFAPEDGTRDAMGDRVWLFCLAALGGHPDDDDGHRSPGDGSSRAAVGPTTVSGG